MSDSIISAFNTKFMELAGRSLEVEIIGHSRTLLEPIHCPDYFASREIAGVNQYVNGSIEYEIRGRRPETVSSGMAIILPAGTMMRSRNMNPGRTISVWHNIRCSILDSIDPLSLLDMPALLSVSDSRKVGEINREIAKAEAEKGSSFIRYVARRHELAAQLFSVIVGASSLKPEAGLLVRRTERLLPVLDHIRRNFTRQITTRELAERISLSPPQLFNLFREAMGMSPGKYVQMQRMRRAQELLLMESDMRICEIAEKSGYPDQFHFSRLFKKSFGVSPELFRQQFHG